MRVVVQRVSEASVTVGGELVGRIGGGLCALVGVTDGDTPAAAAKLADRLARLRIFADGEGKMNRSVLDTGGSVLVDSQFTLFGDTSSGNRPGFSAAARPEVAEPLIDLVSSRLRSLGIEVATGRFGADMDLDLTNRGPVTLIIDVPGA
jgi:D-tyrosyl-tRNA(Tyr) deacylase